MSYKQVGSIRYFVFDLLEKERVTHGLITRRGGVSKVPFDSLNLGGTVGDETTNVIENRRLVNITFGIKSTQVFDVWQVHGTDIICTEKPRLPNQVHQKADAILTNRDDLWLFMRFADCVPILLFDPITKVIGIIHAGWKGTVSGIAGKTVKKMSEYYGSNPADIIAGIGPSIGPDHYHVRNDVIHEVDRSFGSESKSFLLEKEGVYSFDLWESNRWFLRQAGVEKIEIAKICTSCHLDDWFSHRAEQGKTGRFGAVIGLSA
jgi:YfiH family protein